MAQLEFVGEEEDHLFHHPPMLKFHHLAQILHQICIHHPHHLPTPLLHMLATALCLHPTMPICHHRTIGMCHLPIPPILTSLLLFPHQDIMEVITTHHILLSIHHNILPCTSHHQLHQTLCIQLHLVIKHPHLLKRHKIAFTSSLQGTRKYNII